MALLLAWLVILTAATTYADKCRPSVTIKRWQKYSPCAQRTALGVLIGYGYNLNLPHAKNDLAILGMDRNDIPKGIITEAYSECDCEKSVCLTEEQSQRLFDINVDRAQKQVSSSISSTSTLCCDIKNALTGLMFTFGMEKVMGIQDFLTYAKIKNWKKLGDALLKESWCKSSNRCKTLAERISESCSKVGMNLGCSPPTPQACDQSGKYCCASNNTCCQYGKMPRIIFVNCRLRWRRVLFG